jgi:hypothetical protein
MAHRRAVSGWQAMLRTTRGEQPRYSPLAILTALTLRAVFRLALRQTEGLIGSIISRLGPALAIPDHPALSRLAETLDISQPRSSTGVDGEAKHLPVDSAELKLCDATNGWSKSMARRPTDPGGSRTLAWTLTQARSLLQR